jgi:hypothetical protein
MDTRRWGPGERLVFEKYTQNVFEESQGWMSDHGIFTPDQLHKRGYEESVLTLME